MFGVGIIVNGADVGVDATETVHVSVDGTGYGLNTIVPMDARLSDE
jgi:hypothetical protein